MVLLYWTSIGVVVGIAAHLLMRSRGEQGYNVIGETLLGSLGALVLAMFVGIALGWRHIDVTSGIVAAIGATAVLAVIVVLTLQSGSGRSTTPPD